METSDLPQLKITYKPIGSLASYPNNSRKHSQHQIRQIASSIKAFGFTNPILIEQNDTVIAGHGRVAAAKLLDMDQVPAIRLEGLSRDQIRAYVIADNRLAEKAGWDKSILAIELQHLLTIDSDLDVTLTGLREKAHPEIARQPANLVVRQLAVEGVSRALNLHEPPMQPPDQ
jgi:ParB-like chromosome segregation protein Spo0J